MTQIQSKEKALDVIDSLANDKFLSQLAIAAPSKVDHERMVRIVQTVCRADRKLAECSRASLSGLSCEALDCRNCRINSTCARPT